MMKRFTALFGVLLALLPGLLCSCSKLKDIEFTSFHIVSVAPSSFRSVDMTLNVGVSNPSVELELLDFEAELFRQGQTLGTMTLDPVTILPKCEKEYSANAHVALAQGVSVLKLMSLVSEFDPSGYTVDIDGAVKLKSGVKKHIRLEKQPLSKLMKK